MRGGARDGRVPAEHAGAWNRRMGEVVTARLAPVESGCALIGFPFSCSRGNPTRLRAKKLLSGMNFVLRNANQRLRAWGIWMGVHFEAAPGARDEETGAEVRTAEGGVIRRTWSRRSRK